jgi:hypothetical protein
MEASRPLACLRHARTRPVPERVKLADLPALLRKLAPDWPPYRSRTGVDLRDLLDG